MESAGSFSSTSQTNVQLLLRGKDHRDKEARELLAQTYLPKLLAYARACSLQPADCDDMAQECLRKLFGEVLPRFEHDGRLGGFRAYLRNMVQNEVKRRGRHQQVVDKYVRTAAHAPDPQADGAVLESLIEEEDVRFCLDRALHEITQHQRDIFAAHCLRELPVKAVCEQFGVTPNVVYKVKNTMKALFEKWRARSAEPPAEE